MDNDWYVIDISNLSDTVRCNLLTYLLNHNIIYEMTNNNNNYVLKVKDNEVAMELKLLL